MRINRVDVLKFHDWIGEIMQMIFEMFQTENRGDEY